jgi:hypothetical protein
LLHIQQSKGGRRDRDRIVGGFTNYPCNRYLSPLML